MRSQTGPALPQQVSGVFDGDQESGVGSPYVTQGRELCLTNPGQLTLLLAMKERGVPLRTAVRGFSMAPFIRDRDVLTIVPVGGRLLRAGDVVAFKHPENGRLVIHRIVGSSATGWVIKGDSCHKPDGPVSQDLVLGRVARVERGGREVRIGLGRERAAIAVLSRWPGLALAWRLWLLPRRTAGHMLRCAQGLLAYRRIARTLMGPVNIAPAGEKDLEQFRRFTNPDAQHSHRHASPNTRGFVATIGGRVIGFVEMVDRPADRGPWSGCWLHSLWVRTVYRGLGIGEKLTRRVISEARKKGAPQIMLAVHRENSRAIRLYEKMGFSQVALPGIEPLLIEEEAGGGRRRITMCRTLTGDHDQ